MSAPPFFQSAGRGDLTFWGEDDGPTIVVWESSSESEQEQWLEKMGKSKDWVVWCRSRKKDEEQRPFDVDGKEIFSNRSKQANPKAGEKTDKKGGKENGAEAGGVGLQASLGGASGVWLQAAQVRADRMLVV